MNEVNRVADSKAALKDAAANDAKTRDAALDAAVTQIERQFGAGSVMRLGDESAIQVEAIPTGALSLDLAMGVGGVPRGRIVEIFGPESSGKTTLVRSGAVDIVAIDSVAALTPRAELEGQMGETQVGLQARLMSQALRKLAGNLSRANTVCIFTNQIREKIGVQFGSPETQPGGRALKFYSSQRLDIRRIETLKEGTEAVGNRVRVKVVKNKVAAPFRQAEFDIEYGTGISKQGCLLDLGLEDGLIQKSGSFFSYGDLRLGQGRNNAKQYLAENPKLAEEIEAKLLAKLGVEHEASAGEPGIAAVEAGEPAKAEAAKKAA
jgi:recombination protein RecA